MIVKNHHFFFLSPAVLTEKVEIFADCLIFRVFFANGVGCGGQIFFFGGWVSLTLYFGWVLDTLNIFPG